MKKMYLLQDGTYADPADCTDQGGVLRHKDGLKVSMSEDGTPMEVNRNAELHMNVMAAKVGESELAPPDVPAAKAAPDAETEK